MDTDLFPDRPHAKRSRASRKAETDALKEKHGIWTHCMNYGERDWLAISIPASHEMLEGYDLTEEEKIDPVMLMAGYCRLIEECGLLSEGHKTEYEAVKALSERLEKP